MKPVIWSHAAADDLDAIVAYIAREQGERAFSVAERIQKTGSDLGTFATGHSGRVAGTYEKTVSDLPYTIAYMIEEIANQTEQITILRVIHDARNWTKGSWP